MKSVIVGAVTVYYPGAECCAPAIQTQIGWRKIELAQLQKRSDKLNEELMERQEEAATYSERSTAMEAVRVRELAKKTQRGFLVHSEILDAQVRELRQEIARLEGLLK